MQILPKVSQEGDQLVASVTTQFIYETNFMYDMRDNDMLVKPCFRTMKHGYKSIAYQGAKL